MKTEAPSDLARLIADAKSTPREAFVQRHTVPFFVLMVARRREDGALPFRTELGEDLDGEDSVSMVVLPITKSAASPYTDRISIGRARNCDVVLRHPSVSKLHAHVRFDEQGGMLLIDVGSANGTEVDARRLAREVPAALRVGAHVRFGDVSGNVLDAARLHGALLRLGG